MEINNDNKISAFEEKTTFIELAKKSSNKFIDSNSKKIQGTIFFSFNYDLITASV